MGFYPRIILTACTESTIVCTCCGIYHSVQPNSGSISWKIFSVTFNLQSSEELSGRGIVVGCYDNPDSEGGYELSKAGRRLDSSVEGRLGQLLAVSGGRVRRGDTRLLYDVTTDHTHVAVVGVGPCYPDNGLEDVDMKRQNVRCAAAGESNYWPLLTCTAIPLPSPLLPSPPLPFPPLPSQLAPRPCSRQGWSISCWMTSETLRPVLRAAP